MTQQIVLDALNAIESWYNQHCDGEWEHHSGVTIESTDNPGWLVTLEGFPRTNAELAEVVGDLLREHHAQAATDKTSVRIFAPTLADCLAATAIVLSTR